MVVVGGKESKGTYRFVDRDMIETRIGEAVNRFTVTVSGDALILVSGSERARLERVKAGADASSIGLDESCVGMGCAGKTSAGLKEKCVGMGCDSPETKSCVGMGCPDSKPTDQ